MMIKQTEINKTSRWRFFKDLTQVSEYVIGILFSQGNYSELSHDLY